MVPIKNEDKWLSCKYDKVFKSIMLSNNYLFLNALLSEVIGTKEEVINNLSTENKVKNTKERVKIMDILVETNDAYVNIEVNSNINRIIKKRNFKYITTFYNQFTGNNTFYNNEKKFYQINLNYRHGGTIKRYDYFMQDSHINQKYIDNLQIVEINMDYLKKLWYAKDEKVNEYIHVLMLCLEKEELKILRKERKDDDIIMDYEKAMNKMNSNFKFNWDYEEDNKLLANSFRLEGYEKGIKQGMKKKQVEIAKNLLKINLPIDKIVEVTNLSEAQVQKLM